MALFMEMDQFLMALERNKDTSNESYAEYAVERLGVCITCVSRLRHQLRLVDQENSLTVNESAIIQSYCSQFNQLLHCLRTLSTEWQMYLDTYEVQMNRSAYSASSTSVDGHGRPKFDVTKQQLEYLRSISFNWTQIANLLGVSRTTIYRRRVELGISTNEQGSNVTDDQLLRIMHEIRKNNPCLGETMALGKIRSMGIRATRSRVRHCIRAVDPINTALRWRGELARRQPYCVPGPNSLWHIDGHHKLIRWRFVTHGSIDGHSRLITFLRTSTNNRSNTVYDEFRSAIRTYGLHSRIRTDQGRENILVVRHMLRHRGLDRRSVLVGSSSSVHNQRIERLWRDFHRCVTQLFYRLFYFLEYRGYLNPVSERDIYALHYVFHPRINRAVKEFIETWNNHGVRTERARTLFTAGMLRLRHSGLEAMDFFDIPESQYGVEEEGLVSDSEESGVEVPQSSIQLSDIQLQQLQRVLNPLDECDDYGVNFYFDVVRFLQSMGF